MKFCKPKMAAPFTVRSYQRVTLPRRVSRVVSPCDQNSFRKSKWHQNSWKFCEPKMAAPFTVRSFQRVTLPRRVSRVVSPCGTRARKLRSAVDGTCNRNITGIWVLLLPMVFCNTKIVLTYCEKKYVLVI